MAAAHAVRRKCLLVQLAQPRTVKYTAASKLALTRESERKAQHTTIEIYFESWTLAVVRFRSRTVDHFGILLLLGQIVLHQGR